jgi:hypothetical protein
MAGKPGRSGRRIGSKNSRPRRDSGVPKYARKATKTVTAVGYAPSIPIGAMPPSWPDAVGPLWEEVAASLPPSVATEAHRPQIELLVRAEPPNDRLGSLD